MTTPFAASAASLQKLWVPLLGTALLAFGVQGPPKLASKPSKKPETLVEVATVGRAVPSFRLNNQDGRAISSKARGKQAKMWTVVAFYPKAMTPG